MRAACKAGLAKCSGVHAAGFTLVELVVTLLVLTVLMAIAAPSFRELIANQTVQTAAMDIYTGLVRARSEALKQNEPVTISSASGDVNWTKGWKIANASTDLDKRGASTNVTITGSASSVTYRPSGRVTAGTVTAFDVSATGTTAVRCVRINPSGQPYVTSTTCS